MSEGFTRPEARVLPPESLVPVREPDPAAPQPVHARDGRPNVVLICVVPGTGQDGSLSAGTKVVVLRTDEDDGRSAVVDASGLYVLVATSSLRELGRA
jgi:hypothetical protein